MVTIVDSFDRLSAVWAVVMLAAVWQSTLLAVLIALVASRLPKAGPAVRYWLWQIVALKLLIIGSFWTLLIPLPRWLPHDASNQATRPEASRAASASAGGKASGAYSPPPTRAERGSFGRQSPPSVSSGVSLTSGLMVAWLLVVAIEFLLVARQRARLVRLLRRSRRLENTALKAQLTELSAQLGLKRAPELREVDDASGSPFVCGLWRPLLVLPEGLANTLRPDELRQVLVHELAHLKRGDLIWDWVPTIARMLFFFHPAAHWVNDRILLERELACDQAALRLANQDEAGYARMLVQLASRASFPLR